MSAPPFIKLYVADYLTDTVLLTTEQHGAYHLLLYGMWQAGGELPTNEEGLARFCRVKPLHFRRVIWPAIKGYFIETRPGFITNRRMSEELQKAHEKRARLTANAVLGGEANKARISAIKNQREPRKTGNGHKPNGYPNGKPSGKPFGKPDGSQHSESQIYPPYPPRGELDSSLGSGAPAPGGVEQVQVRVDDPRWRGLAARYEVEKKRKPPIANGAWFFPRSWTESVDIATSPLAPGIE